MTIGVDLAEARNAAGLSLPQLSERTRVREDILAGIETGDFSRCRGNSYARGHLRAYAEAVGLDPAPLLAAFDATHPPDKPDPGTPVLPVPEREGGRGLGKVVALVVLLVVGVLLLARFMGGGDASAARFEQSSPALSVASGGLLVENAWVAPTRHLR